MKIFAPFAFAGTLSLSAWFASMRFAAVAVLLVAIAGLWLRLFLYTEED